jgi:hypothetical protein
MALTFRIIWRKCALAFPDYEPVPRRYDDRIGEEVKVVDAENP